MLLVDTLTALMDKVRELEHLDTAVIITVVDLKTAVCACQIAVDQSAKRPYPITQMMRGITTASKHVHEEIDEAMRATRT